MSESPGGLHLLKRSETADEHLYLNNAYDDASTAVQQEADRDLCMSKDQEAEGVCCLASPFERLTLERQKVTKNIVFGMRAKH